MHRTRCETTPRPIQLKSCRDTPSAPKLRLRDSFVTLSRYRDQDQDDQDQEDQDQDFTDDGGDFGGDDTDYA